MTNPLIGDADAPGSAATEAANTATPGLFGSEVVEIAPHRIRWLARLMYGNAFEVLVIAVIIANDASLAALTYADIDPRVAAVAVAVAVGVLVAVGVVVAASLSITVTAMFWQPTIPLNWPRIRAPAKLLTVRLPALFSMPLSLLRARLAWCRSRSARKRPAMSSIRCWCRS